MSTIDIVKGATKAVLDSVRGVEPSRVYTRQREFTNDKACKLILLGTITPPGRDERINAWMISCIGFEDETKSLGTTGMNQRTYTVQIIGYYGMNESEEPSSEEAFEVLCENISDAIASGIRKHLPASSHIVEFPRFELGYTYIPISDGVLVHQARAVFTLDIWHQRS